MMQQCLPPGNPPARPLDLFDREIPSLWHVRCKNEADAWDVVGLFNFDDRAQERTVDFAALGLPSRTEMAVFEFWEEKLVGIHQDRVTLTMPPQSSRILVMRRLTGRPQVIGTDMHVLGGYHELTRLGWDEAQQTLSGQYRRAPGLAGKAYLYVPTGYRPRSDAAAGGSLATPKDLGGGVWAHQVEFKEATVDWSIAFEGRVRPK